MKIQFLCVCDARKLPSFNHFFNQDLIPGFSVLRISAKLECQIVFIFLTLILFSFLTQAEILNEANIDEQQEQFIDPVAVQEPGHFARAREQSTLQTSSQSLQASSTVATDFPIVFWVTRSISFTGSI